MDSVLKLSGHFVLNSLKCLFFGYTQDLFEQKEIGYLFNYFSKKFKKRYPMLPVMIPDMHQAFKDIKDMQCKSCEGDYRSEACSITRVKSWIFIF